MVYAAVDAVVLISSYLSVALMLRMLISDGDGDDDVGDATLLFIVSVIIEQHR